MNFIAKLSVFLLVIGLTSPLSVQAEWKPTNTIKVYVGFSAGGGADTVARVLVDKISKNTGWNFTVINVTGGGGSVALKTLKDQKADGHAIAFSPSEIFTINPTINPEIGYVTNDFTYIAAVSNTQAGLISMADKPWKTFADVIEAAKSGQKISVAYQAVNMGMMMKAIQKKFGVEFVLVPVQGGNGGMQNLLGNHVDVAWGAGIQDKYVKIGQMKVLASCESERLVMAPDAPTMQELGVEHVELGAKFMFAGPINMPKEVTEVLAKEIKKAAESEEIRDLLANKLSLQAIFLAGEDLQKVMDKSLVKAKNLVDYVK